MLLGRCCTNKEVECPAAIGFPLLMELSSPQFLGVKPAAMQLSTWRCKHQAVVPASLCHKQLLCPPYCLQRIVMSVATPPVL